MHVAQMLAESSEELAEEWAIHDYDGFGSVCLSEYEDLNKVAALGALIAEHGQLFGKLAARFGGIDGIEEARRSLEEGYCGAFDRLGDYAQDLIEDCYGSEIGKLPDFISCHIDYEAIARDMELCGDVFTIEHGHQVHVFHAHV